MRCCHPEFMVAARPSFLRQQIACKLYFLALCLAMACKLLCKLASGVAILIVDYAVLQRDDYSLSYVFDAASTPINLPFEL
jgi:hypothetical protein